MGRTARGAFAAPILYISVPTWAYDSESFIPYFYFIFFRTNPVIGYFADRLQSEQDGIIANTYDHAVIFWSAVFAGVAAVHIFLSSHAIMQEMSHDETSYFGVCQKQISTCCMPQTWC